MRAVVAAERVGVPSVAIVASGFAQMATLVANALGLEDAKLACYPGVIMTDSRETLRSKVREDVQPAIIDALVGTPSSEPGPRPAHDSSSRDSSYHDVYDAARVVFTGDLDAVHDHFEARHWTDGLPIVPPTVDRVHRALAFTDRDPDEPIGVLAPAQVVATPWNVAVNAVMAGCRPELLPFLIAAVEAVADPFFRLEDAGSTPGWEPLVIVSGPGLARFGFHDGAGVMRVGVRANTSVGRFLRLYLRNVAGLRTSPDSTDKASIGLSFNVAMVESDDAVHDVGWPAFREESGFDRADTVVAVQSVVGISTPIYTSGDSPDAHLRVIAEHLAGVSAHWAAVGVVAGGWWPLLVLSPPVAAVLARCGLDPSAVREQLAERALAPAGMMADYVQHTGVEYFDWERFAPDWPDPHRYLRSTDPGRLVPVVLNPATLGIVITGDPGRNQSRVYVNSHMHGARVTRRVQFTPRSTGA